MFTDASSDLTAEGLFQYVTKVVEDLDSSKALVAQTVMAGRSCNWTTDTLVKQVSNSNFYPLL